MTFNIIKINYINYINYKYKKMARLKLDTSAVVESLIVEASMDTPLELKEALNLDCE